MTQTFSSTGRDTFVGSPRSRIDGPAKVTGLAKYAGEFAAPDLAYGYVVSSAIAKGRIVAIDSAKAEAVPGVLKVLTHENRPRTAWRDKNFQDQVAPPGSPFRALYDDLIAFSGQPVALVVAEDFESARYAASLVHVTYAAQEPATDLGALRGTAYEPPGKRQGIKPPPEPWGDADKAFSSAPVRVQGEYSLADEHHNPMEPHASTVVVEQDGTYTVYDKIQGVSNSHQYLTNVFGLKPDQVRVLNPYLGGGFGSGLRPQYQLFLAMLAAQELKRSVRVTLTRDQMWSFTYRSEALQTIALGAEPDGRLTALRHDAVQGTSQYEDYQEVVVNWSGVLYRCDNVALGYQLVKLDTPTPGDMRAPGAVTGVFAIETAMDELAYATGMDPIALRLKNYAEADATAEGKPFGSKELKRCFAQGAERFGWAKRKPEPRSMREGRELVGWGVATGIWESMMMQSSAIATLTPDGRLTVGNSTGDIGTGTYTILTQIAGEMLGLPPERVRVEMGDTDFPMASGSGGSFGAASAGSALYVACDNLRQALLKAGDLNADGATFRDGAVTSGNRTEALTDLAGSGLEASGEIKPGEMKQKYSQYSYGAHFAEVGVDVDTGEIRLRRMLGVFTGGRILNAKTARSQAIGGMTFGVGAA